MNTNEMKVLMVGGAPRERGRAIGESLREDIHAVMAKHEQAIDRALVPCNNYKFG